MIRRILCSVPLKTLIFRSHNEMLAGRTLYTKAALGLEGYEFARSKYSDQFGDDVEPFMGKMKGVIEKETNAVYTDDLKAMLHLAHERDVPLVRDMVLRFENQNSQIRFGNFVFGPVIMRMFYHFNKPQEALELFKSSKGLLDQIVSFQILMDLLFKNECYQEVLDVFDLIKEKQIQGSKYPRNLVVLTFGACYKLNTPEAFEYATKLWSELMQVGHQPMRRAATFFAALALKQNKPDVALEVLSTVQKKNYVTVRNLRACALSQVGRLEEAVNALEEIIVSDRVFRPNTVSEETVTTVKQAVEKSGNANLIDLCTKVESKLRSMNQIDNKVLDSLLCSEIDKVVMKDDGQFEGRQRDQRNQRPSFNYRTPRFTNNPGLSEMT